MAAALPGVLADWASARPGILAAARDCDARCEAWKARDRVAELEAELAALRGRMPGLEATRREAEAAVEAKGTPGSAP